MCTSCRPALIYLFGLFLSVVIQLPDSALAWVVSQEQAQSIPAQACSLDASVSINSATEYQVSLVFGSTASTRRITNTVIYTLRQSTNMLNSNAAEEYTPYWITDTGWRTEQERQQFASNCQFTKIVETRLWTGHNDCDDAASFNNDFPGCSGISVVAAENDGNTYKYTGYLYGSKVGDPIFSLAKTLVGPTRNLDDEASDQGDETDIDLSGFRIKTATGGSGSGGGSIIAVVDNTPPSFTITTNVSPANRSSGFVATVTFDEEVKNFADGDLAATNAIVGNLSTADNKVFSATITPSGPGDIVLSIAANAAEDLAGNGNTMSASLTIEDNTQQISQELLGNFLQNRSNNLLNNRPNLINLSVGSGPANGAGGPLGYLSANGDSRYLQFRFATSRSKLLAAGTHHETAEANQSARSRIARSFGDSDNTLSDYPNYGIDGALLSFVQEKEAPPTDNHSFDQKAEEDRGFNGKSGTWDIWTEIYGSRSSAGDSQSSLWVGYLGLHYFVNDFNAVGLLAQLDWSDEENSVAGSSASGTGWMIGPYAAGKFPEQNLFYEVSAAYGQSDNKFSPFGTYRDSFDTTRWMLSGKLTGEVIYDNVRIRPEVGLAWYEEEQHSYIDSLGNPIPGQTVSLGELRFGPTFSSTRDMVNGSVLQLNFGVGGVYNFDIADSNTSQASPIGTDELRARLNAGLALTEPENGISLTAEVFYDGVGISDYETYGGRVRLTVPLQ